MSLEFNRRSFLKYSAAAAVAVAGSLVNLIDDGNICKCKTCRKADKYNSEKCFVLS